MEGGKEIRGHLPCKVKTVSLIFMKDGVKTYYYFCKRCVSLRRAWLGKGKVKKGINSNLQKKNQHCYIDVFFIRLDFFKVFFLL